MSWHKKNSCKKKRWKRTCLIIDRKPIMRNAPSLWVRSGHADFDTAQRLQLARFGMGHVIPLLEIDLAVEERVEDIIGLSFPKECRVENAVVLPKPGDGVCRVKGPSGVDALDYCRIGCWNRRGGIPEPCWHENVSCCHQLKSKQVVYQSFYQHVCWRTMRSPILFREDTQPKQRKCLSR